MLKPFFFLYFLFLLTALHAQTSLNTSGGNILSTSGNVSYSVGQVFYDTTDSNSGSVSAGVQQALEIYRLSTNNVQDIKVSISTYPNPTKDILNISIREDNRVDYRLVLYSLEGRIIQEVKPNDTITQLDLSTLPASVYILQVFNKTKEVESFKIIKK